MGPRNPTSKTENWFTVAFKSVDREDLLLRRTTEEEVTVGFQGVELERCLIQTLLFADGTVVISRPKTRYRMWEDVIRL